jgi:hypothetical protein
MAGRSSQSFQKRQKEQQRKERQEEKRIKRLQRKEEGRPPEEAGTDELPGVDDLIGSHPDVGVPQVGPDDAPALGEA